MCDIMATHAYCPTGGARQAARRSAAQQVDSCLHDEAQQYGNLDGVTAYCPTAKRVGLAVWTGDHRQTPGGQKSLGQRIPQ